MTASLDAWYKEPDRVAQLDGRKGIRKQEGGEDIPLSYQFAPHLQPGIEYFGVSSQLLLRVSS